MSLSVPRSSKVRASNRSDSGRLKVALKPGHGLMDWISLSSGKCLASKKQAVVDHIELAKHRSRDDCWILLADKVYDVTQYVPFHPGGEDELLRAAGCDGSTLFNKYHPWINYERMLEACFVGNFKGDRNKLDSPRASNSECTSSDTNEEKDRMLLSTLGIKSVDWEYGRLQFADSCSLQFTSDNVSADVHDGLFRVLFRPYCEPSFAITWDVPRPLTCGHFSMEVDRKGVTLQFDHAEDLEMFTSAKLRRVECDPCPSYRSYSVEDIRFVTHNCSLYVLSVPPSVHFSLPIGHHVKLQINKKGSSISRPYTPVMISEDRRSILFIIKIYSDGIFTPVLASLKPGDSIEVSDGIGQEDIFHRCTNRVILLAAGTGLTPMIRLIAARARSPSLFTLLLLFNKRKADIPSEDVLRYCGVNVDEVSFKMINYLSHPDRDWDGQTGIVSREVIESHIHFIANEGPGYRVLICGPDQFVTQTLWYLQACRVLRTGIFVFQD